MLQWVGQVFGLSETSDIHQEAVVDVTGGWPGLWTV